MGAGVGLACVTSASRGRLESSTARPSMKTLNFQSRLGAWSMGVIPRVLESLIKSSQRREAYRRLCRRGLENKRAAGRRHEQYLSAAASRQSQAGGEPQQVARIHSIADRQGGKD